MGVGFDTIRLSAGETAIRRGLINQTPAGSALGFDFDLLGRLRRYDTDDRASTFAYDGTKRLGDNDAEAGHWKRYHWCQSQLLGYEDGSSTYYIVPDMEGSTKIIIDSSQGVVNRLDYDTLGNIRNQTAPPQVELLWRGKVLFSCSDLYLLKLDIYDPILGSNMIVIHHESDITKIMITPWHVGLIVFGSFIITYALDSCRRALQELEDLHAEWNTMQGYSDPSLREAQAATWGFGSYSSWSRSWVERSHQNGVNVSAYCRGIDM